MEKVDIGHFPPKKNSKQRRCLCLDSVCLISLSQASPKCMDMCQNPHPFDHLWKPRIYDKRTVDYKFLQWNSSGALFDHLNAPVSTFLFDTVPADSLWQFHLILNAAPPRSTFSNCPSSLFLNKHVSPPASFHDCVFCLQRPTCCFPTWWSPLSASLLFLTYACAERMTFSLTACQHRFHCSFLFLIFLHSESCHERLQWSQDLSLNPYVTEQY